MSKYKFVLDEMLEETPSVKAAPNHKREPRKPVEREAKVWVKVIAKLANNLRFDASLHDLSEHGCCLKVPQTAVIPGWLFGMEIIVDCPSVHLYDRDAIARWQKPEGDQILIGIAFS